MGNYALKSDASDVLLAETAIHARGTFCFFTEITYGIVEAIVSLAGHIIG